MSEQKIPWYRYDRGYPKPPKSPDLDPRSKLRRFVEGMGIAIGWTLFFIVFFWGLFAWWLPTFIWLFF
jgi:hypothetical protein